MASTRDLIEELLTSHEPRIRDAFIGAVDDIRSAVTLAVLVDRLERGDIQGAIEALQIEPDAYARVVREIERAYDESGEATVENLPTVREPSGNRVVFRFGVRNLVAEQELRQHSSELVTRITEDQRDAVRQHLMEGLSEGANPRQTALNVVGRINRATGRREGGIIGLTAPQERFVAAARRELASGDPEALRHYLTRQRRDRRFDRAVQAAIREERPVPPESVNRMVGRYSDRLLQLRGEMLARTETITALGKARDDAIRQQIESGKIDAQDVTKIWRSAGDLRVRHTHIRLHGQTVGFDETFLSPSGARLRYPGDPQAPGAETIGCRCWLEYRIDFMASVVRRHGRAA